MPPPFRPNKPIAEYGLDFGGHYSSDINFVFANH
jgi:hypothetical protein